MLWSSMVRVQLEEAGLTMLWSSMVRVQLEEAGLTMLWSSMVRVQLEEASLAMMGAGVHYDPAGRSGPHHALVQLEEAEEERPIEQVGEADEGLLGVGVEQQDGGDERHALDVADVGPVAGVGAQQLVQQVMVRTALPETGGDW